MATGSTALSAPFHACAGVTHMGGGSMIPVAGATGRLGGEIPVSSMGMSGPIPGMPELLAGFARALATYETPLEMADTAARSDVALTPVEQFIERAFTRSVDLPAS
jgi:hypothetical protein